MAKRVGIEVSLAVSEAVMLANVDVIAAYPITPQTHIVEHLSELVADGHLDAEFIPVESEHSAMSTCCGSSAAGARTYTATSSQGQALMLEICYRPGPATSHCDDGCQPVAFGSDQHLERSFRYDDEPRYWLDSNGGRKRPGGF
jgi:hypothetical protein